MKTRLSYLALILSGISFCWLTIRLDGLIPLPLRWLVDHATEVIAVSEEAGEELPTLECVPPPAVFKHSLREVTRRPSLVPSPLKKVIDEPEPEDDPEEKVPSSPVPEVSEELQAPESEFRTASPMCILPPPPLPPEVEEVFKVVEKMPRFPGCEDISGDDNEKKTCADKKMLEFIYKNVRYPAIARESSIDGTVVLQFVVEKDGTLTEMDIVRDIGGECSLEVLRILNLMNERGLRWSPGIIRGRPVRTQLTLPVRFELR